jgi:hypothetical protein
MTIRPTLEEIEFAEDHAERHTAAGQALQLQRSVLNRKFEPLQLDVREAEHGFAKERATAPHRAAKAALDALGDAMLQACAAAYVASTEFPDPNKKIRTWFPDDPDDRYGDFAAFARHLSNYDFPAAIRPSWGSTRLEPIDGIDERIAELRAEIEA